MDGYKSYDVTVDYITTATLTVSAADEEQAEELVQAYIESERGQDDLLRRMAVTRNVPDGFEIAMVEEAGPRVPDLYWADHARGDY